MHKVLTSIFVLLSAVAVCAPVRDATAAKNLQDTETPVYENLWTWPTGMITATPALPSDKFTINTANWYNMVAASGYRQKGNASSFCTDYSLTSYKVGNGYFIGRLLPLDAGIYKLYWHQDNRGTFNYSIYEPTEDGKWKWVRQSTSLINPAGDCWAFLEVPDDGAGIMFLFTKYYYATDDDPVTFTDIELYKVD